MIDMCTACFESKTFIGSEDVSVAETPERAPEAFCLDPFSRRVSAIRAASWLVFHGQRDFVALLSLCSSCGRTACGPILQQEWVPKP